MYAKWIPALEIIFCEKQGNEMAHHLALAEETSPKFEYITKVAYCGIWFYLRMVHKILWAESMEGACYTKINLHSIG